jgi:prophage DNA circulation protein
MAWKDRLRPDIVLISPEGNTFFAKWRGDDISISKRVNRQAHPDRDGESAQDLGLNSRDYPLTIYFDGADHDAEAIRFSRAIAERGVWEVNHPVYGRLRLQPVKITLRPQPVESGNITEVSGEWFEPAGDYEHTPNPEAAVGKAVEELNQSILDEIANEISAILGKVQDFTNGIKSLVRKIRSAINTVTAIQNAIVGTINSAATFTKSVIASVSGAVTGLVQFPGLFAGNMRSQVDSFKKLGASLTEEFKNAVSLTSSALGSSTPESAKSLRSAAAANSLALSAITGGMALAVISTPPKTRAEAITTLKAYTEFVAEMEASIESAAKATSGLPIEDQIMGRSASAEALRSLNSAVARYLLDAAFNLKTEKKIVLERPASPLLLAVREYGASAAGADAAFDLLCRSNNLHGKELLLLDRGREIVVYQ